jgi:hypothetical protein
VLVDIATVLMLAASAVVLLAMLALAGVNILGSSERSGYHDIAPPFRASPIPPMDEATSEADEE